MPSRGISKWIGVCSIRMQAKIHFYARKWFIHHRWVCHINLPIFAYRKLKFFLPSLSHSQTYYYFAIIEDTTLRFIWIASFVLTEKKIVSVDFLVSVMAILEVFRRFVWNFFRLENEHLNNCGQFRAVRDISIAPIDSSDQTTILKMMDDPDGVINR